MIMTFILSTWRFMMAIDRSCQLRLKRAGKGVERCENW
jgi:hypothetical protein